MLKSEKCWALKIITKNIVSEGVKPERKSLSSIFSISEEEAFFDSNEAMKPFNFDRFRFTLISLYENDSIRVGVSIM